MALTIIGTVSVLAVVIGVIISVFQAPSSGTLVRGRALVMLFIVDPLGAVSDLVYRAGTGPQGDRRRSGGCSSRTDSPMSPLGGEPVFV
jgi:hypothetical protein